MSDATGSAKLASRILVLEWVDDDLRAPSRAALMSEFLRRTALWAQALGCPQLWPYFDVAAQVDPSVRAEPALVRRVRGDIDERGGGLTEQRLAEYALHFAALGPTAIALADPFAPLIALWERGGRFRREAGLVYFGATGVRTGSIEDHLSAEPVAKAEPAAMDAADARWRVRLGL